MKNVDPALDDSKIVAVRLPQAYAAFRAAEFPYDVKDINFPDPVEDHENAANYLSSAGKKIKLIEYEQGLAIQRKQVEFPSRPLDLKSRNQVPPDPIAEVAKSSGAASIDRMLAAASSLRELSGLPTARIA